MKKSLSLVLAIALVFSMFSSMAFAADTSKTTLDKFNELKQAGIFSGVDSSGNAALDRVMTRAEAAVVIAKLFGLDYSSAPETPTFTDVSADDWSYNYVEAAAQVEVDVNGETQHIFNGYQGKFMPNDQLTVQDLAVIIGQALHKYTGLAIDADATVDGTAADYAQPYVAALVDAGVIAESNDYTVQATRGALVDVSYEAEAAVEQANEVPSDRGISKVEATDASELTVTFDGPVDTDKAELAVKKDGSTVAIESDGIKWSDDTKSAVITLASKLSTATYTVTLSGVDNLNEDKASASVDAQAELVKSIEFLTASDTLPIAKNVKIEFQALNQYGKKADVDANDFNIYVSDDDQLNPKFSSKETSFTLNTAATEDGDDAFRTGDMISISILDQNSGAQAFKTFTVGADQIVTKVEVGDLKNENGDKLDYIKAGDSAYLDFTAYDQYGLKVTDEDALNDSVSVFSSNRDLEPGDGTDDDIPFVADVDGDDEADLMLTSTVKEASTSTISIYAAGSSATKQVDIKTVKAPASVEIPDYDGTIADGDLEMWIPIVVKDSEGTELTPQEIKDNVQENPDLFHVNVSGPLDLDDQEIELVDGDHIGQIHVDKVDGYGTARVEVYLDNDPQDRATMNVNVNKQREYDTVVWDDEADSKVQLGADSDFDVHVLDQYGAEYDDSLAAYEDMEDYRVVVSLDTDAAGTIEGPNDTVLDKDNAKESYKISDIDDATFNIVTKENTAEDLGTYRLDISLVDDDGKTVDDLATKTIKVINGREDNEDLTYSGKLDDLNDDSTIMAARDVYYYSVPGSVYGSDSTPLSDMVELTNLAKQVEVTAKDSSGKSVAINQVITRITSSNSSVAGGAKASDGNYYVIGLNPGKTNITVYFNTPTGGSSTTIPVTVSNDAPVVTSISLDKSSPKSSLSIADINGEDGNGTPLWYDNLANKITVDDQYGDEFVSGDSSNDQNEIGDYSDILDLTYQVTDQTWSGTSSKYDSVTINPDTGVLKYNDNGGRKVTSFVVNVTANGHTASFTVYME